MSELTKEERILKACTILEAKTLAYRIQRLDANKQFDSVTSTLINCKEGCEQFPEITRNVSKQVYSCLPLLLKQEIQDFLDDNPASNRGTYYNRLIKNADTYPHDFYNERMRLAVYFILKYRETNPVRNRRRK